MNDWIKKLDGLETLQHLTIFPFGESFIGNFLSVGNKKILLPTDLLTEQTRKKNLPASFLRYFPRKISSVIPSVII
jgi:hypothetical protein